MRKLAASMLACALALAPPAMPQDSAPAGRAEDPIATPAVAPAGGSRASAPVLVGLGLVLGMVLIIGALNATGPGFPDTSP